MSWRLAIRNEFGRKVQRRKAYVFFGSLVVFSLSGLKFPLFVNGSRCLECGFWGLRVPFWGVWVSFNCFTDYLLTFPGSISILLKKNPFSHNFSNYFKN